MGDENVSRILIGIDAKFSSELEKRLVGRSYNKEICFDKDFFTLVWIDWNAGDDLENNLMDFLLNIVKYDYFGFIRIGEPPGDIEIHGNVGNFGITFSQEYHY